MASELEVETRERERLQPYAETLMEIVRQADPEAAYDLCHGPDEGIWVLNVYVRPPLDDDLDRHATVTDRAVDFQVEDGVSLAVIPHQRAAVGEA